MSTRSIYGILTGLLLAAALLAAFFGPVLWGGQVYYAGDIARIYHPQRVALARALAQARLPWWTPEVGIGYPMLAEGEIGALYPLNWPLYLLLAPERALSLSIVLHYCLAGLGLYALGRALTMGRMPSLLASIVYALGGFNIAHLTHVSILSVAAWLPWLLACTHRLVGDHAPGAEPGAGPSFRTDRRWAWALALAAVTALQFLAGHAQISLLGLLAVGLVGTGVAVQNRRRAGMVSSLALWVGALALGTCLALPQLLPSAQLGALSQRAGGLESEFFTSYSFHPFLTSTFVMPYLLGAPHPEGSIELMGYLGMLPLALAALSLGRPRGGGVWLYVALAALGLFMAFGRWNPLYALLARVPVLNLFRVPARYLLWTSLALAVLAGRGLERLLARAAPNTDRLGLLFVGVTLVGATVIASLSLSAPNLDALVERWRWLPLLLALATAALLLGARRTPAPLLVGLACLLTAADLYAYSAVLNRTYNQTVPLAELQAPPRVLDVLADEPHLHRLYTKPEILPILSVQRESLYPNIALAYGRASANVYMPLVPRAYEAYLAELDAERLTRLNVRYYLIPQLLPVDEASELYDVHNPFASIPYDRWHPLRVEDVSLVEVESFVSHAAYTPDGALAARLRLRGCDGQTLEFPLRVGVETAEWAYARSDVAANVRHSRPPIATTFPARSGFPPEDHPGHTYLATWSLPEATSLCGLYIEPVFPEAFVRVERIRLSTSDGSQALVSHLLGLGDHSIIYRSEDVLVYENHDVLPRAYALPLEQVTLGRHEALLPPGSLHALLLPVEIADYEPHRVVLHADLAEDALLVLADLHYPGWRATVDGQPARILAVDGVFRGIVLPAGRHAVRLEYAPLP